MKAAALLAPALALGLSSCVMNHDTVPGRSATEEMTITTAADRAADKLASELTAGGSVYVDPTYFDAPDAKYAIGAIRAAIARRGTKLAADRQHADRVVEIRSGALSIDQNKFLIGIPEFAFPIPVAGVVTFPEIALYSFHDNQGVAKFAATEITQNDGALVVAPEPNYAYSHNEKRTLLIFISWSHQDYIDKKDEDPEDSK
jgi:hypothetical protein